MIKTVQQNNRKQIFDIEAHRGGIGVTNAPQQVGERRYTYSASGNPLTIEGGDVNRTLTWDTENRLRQIYDSRSGQLHLYTYNHLGERALKRYGKAQTMAVNDKDAGALLDTKDNYSAYVSPYFVRHNNRYTKHYYAGAMRIASKIGASGSTYAAGTDEPDLYFYHTDHLGSTTYITDRKEVAQYVAYTPYGETFKEYKNVTPYKFNGKELDQETGYYYYGARYYDPGTALWFGVDPLAGKYPMNSPYIYCNGNPVKYVDPDGMDWITASYENDTFVFYDKRVHSEADIKSVYYYKDGAKGRNSYDIKYVGKSGSFTRECDGGKTFSFNSDGTYSINGVVQNGEYDRDGLHIGSTLYTLINPAEGACQNDFYGNYAGGSNPSKSGTRKKVDSYAMPPIDDLDYAAFKHDKGYDKVGARNIKGAFFDIRVIDIDYNLGYDCLHVSSNGSTYKARMKSALTAFSFTITGIKEMLR